MINNVPKKMQDRAFDLFRSIDILKKNIDGCSKEELEGRYKKALNYLKQKIREEADAFLVCEISRKTDFKNEKDKADFLLAAEKEWEWMIKKESKNGLFKDISSILYEECNMKKYIVQCMRLSEVFRNLSYKEYWLSHCYLVNGRTYYNDIINMFWDKGAWYSCDRECTVAQMPPTRASYRAEYVAVLKDCDELLLKY